MASPWAYDSWQDDVDGFWNGTGQYLWRNASSMGMNFATRAAAGAILDHPYSNSEILRFGKSVWQSPYMSNVRGTVSAVGNRALASTRGLRSSAVGALQHSWQSAMGRILSNRGAIQEGVVGLPYKSVYKLWKWGAKDTDSLLSVMWPKAGHLVEKTKKFLPKGETVAKVWNKTIGAAPGAVVKANRGIGEVVGALTPQVTKSGIGHKVISKAFSARGAALGFAIGGVSDAIRGIANNDFDYDSLGWKYVDGWDLTKKSIGRIFWGTGRAIDSALFGLPGLIPGLGAALNSDDYVNPGIELSEYEENLQKQLASASKEDAIKLYRERDRREREMLRKGKDLDGKPLYVTGSDGKPREFTAAEGAKMAEILDKENARAAAERRLAMVDDTGAFEKDVDIKALRSGLAKIDAKFNEERAKLYNHYDNFDAYVNSEVPVRMRSRADFRDRDAWLPGSEAWLVRKYNQRRQAITKSSVYADLVRGNRESALTAYRNYATARGMDDGTAVSRFTEFWDSQDDWYKENTGGSEFMASLVGASRVAAKQPEVQNDMQTSMEEN